MKRQSDFRVNERLLHIFKPPPPTGDFSFDLLAVDRFMPSKSAVADSSQVREKSTQALGIGLLKAVGACGSSTRYNE